MRNVRAAGPEILKIGRARATAYGRRDVWVGLDRTEFPVVRIGEDGTPTRAGDVITLASRETAWMPSGAITCGLPVDIADAQPAGFLGRHFAVTHADLGLPPRLSDWSDHHILLAMASRGEDLPGNLMLGEESFARWQALVVASHTRDDYPALANDTTAGHPPGSSAGGERPKFCAFVDGQHRLVKFAARSGGTASQRWCDLLILEHTALEIAAAHGVPAAGSRLVEHATHWCLETDRFDRVGARGRVAVLSLAAAHDNLGDSWARAAHALHAAAALSAVDARHVCWLDAFGALIANTDRHHFNLLFFPSDDGRSRLRMAPAFDQASMLYAPTPDAQVPPRQFTVPLMTTETLDVWPDARAAAREFWTRGCDDERISADMRAICGDNAARLAG